MPDVMSAVLAEVPIVAASAVSLPISQVQALRSAVGPGAAAYPQIPKVLRNADEQTIAAMSALLHSIDASGLTGESFRTWGVIGGPRFLGRTFITAAIHRYYGDPKHSLTPHIIPNLTLHALAGTASICLGMHGPNFGVGGGPGHVEDTLLTGVSVFAEGRVPGLWLLLSCLSPEPRPDSLGQTDEPITVHGIAIGLSKTAKPSGSIRLIRGETETAGRGADELAHYISASSGDAWTCSVAGLGLLS